MDKPAKTSEPANTHRLLSDLNSTIDEAKLVRQIVSLSDNLRNIDGLPYQEDRVEYLQSEILKLERQLTELRSK